jgi:membrane protease YdiL (CAAX protease family)
MIRSSSMDRVGPLPGTGAGGVPAPTPAQVGRFTVFVAVLFLLGGGPLQSVFGGAGVMVAEWGLLFFPAVVFAHYMDFDARRVLSLRLPSGRQIGGGLLLMAGALPVVWLVGWTQTVVLPARWVQLDGIEAMVTAESLSHFAWLILVLALTPAVCEEVVFRGVLLGGTRSLGPWRMLLLNGAVFGTFHLSFETPVRFLPTATLGIVIAWAVWHTGSLLVGVAMHFINNGTIIALASTPVLNDTFSDPAAHPPLWLVAIGGTLAAIGGRMIFTSGLGPPRPATLADEEP